MKKGKLRFFNIVVVTLLLGGIGVLIKPAFHLLWVSSRDTTFLKQVPVGYVDDASGLNQTKISEIWRVPIDGENLEQQIAELLKRAREEGLRVSLAGAQHSMGGHTIYPGGIVINMTQWKRMKLDEARNILKVQSGARWDDILAYLDGKGRSVSVMQSNNSFSVGGSISVNCHGWQFDRPPIASTVESFRLMQADGTILSCSRSHNEELFSLVLGGYGLFGIILDVELQVVPNERYRLEQYIVPIDKSLTTFEREIEVRSGAQMVYARMNVVPERMMEDVILNAFIRDSEGDPPALTNPGLDKLRRAVFRGAAENDYGKELRWEAETKIQPILRGKFFSRNQLLNEGVEVFENRSAETTDILHEYFVPQDKAPLFIEEVRGLLVKYSPNLMNVTVRSVNKDKDTFLSYANQQVLAFVMLFEQEKNEEGESEMEALTRDLIDASIKYGGRYYLPYRLHATPAQFHRAYPQAREFFELKRKYDSGELFQNKFYLMYGRGSD